ncbi:MAG: hypothetical protein RBS99_16295 [Rhodospirillales bacterium]|jgi:hypothetical protein|nr:hypothetical protein [Rhodospirillales bacterium]
MPRISAKDAKPKVDRAPTEEMPVATEEQPAAAPVQIVERRIELVTVEVPLGEPPRRFDQVHIEGWLRGDVAHTFARIRQALWDQGAKTADGRPCKSNPDVMRWLMEQFAQ